MFRKAKKEKIHMYRKFSDSIYHSWTENLISKIYKRSVIIHSRNLDKSQKVLTSSEDDTGSSPIPSSSFACEI